MEYHNRYRSAGSNTLNSFNGQESPVSAYSHANRVINNALELCDGY